MAELMLGQPLFPGESGIDQLVEIIKILGTPTREQIKTMNPNYMEHKFPQIKPHPFVKVSSSQVHKRLGTPFDEYIKVFRPRTAPEAIDLVSKLLEYTPAKRLTAVEGMIHEFFDELRVEGVRMPNGREFPRLFDFTREGEFRLRESHDCCRANRTNAPRNRAVYSSRSQYLPCSPLDLARVGVSRHRLAKFHTHTSGEDENHAGLIK